VSVSSLNFSQGCKRSNNPFPLRYALAINDAPNYDPPCGASTERLRIVYIYPRDHNSTKRKEWDGGWSLNPDTDELLHFEHVFIDKKGPENPHIKVVGDINRDGFVDVVVASSNGGSLVWYEYPNWTKHVIIPSGWWSTDAKLFDLDKRNFTVVSRKRTQNLLLWHVSVSH